MELISKSIARSFGLKRYFTGKPCSHGHIAERYVSTGNCTECIGNASSDNYTFMHDIEAIRKRIETMPTELLNIINDTQTQFNAAIAEIDKKISLLQAQRAGAITQLNIKIGNFTEQHTTLLQKLTDQLTTLERRKKQSEIADNMRINAANITAERTAALPKMAIVNIEVMPRDIEAAQALILRHTATIWPSVTINDVWHSETPKHGVLYKVSLPIASRTVIEETLRDMRARSKPDIVQQAHNIFSALTPEAPVAITPSIDDTFK